VIVPDTPSGEVVGFELRLRAGVASFGSGAVEERVVARQLRVQRVRRPPDAKQRETIPVDRKAIVHRRLRAL
jgi:hypothetical protein